MSNTDKENEWDKESFKKLDDLGSDEWGNIFFNKRDAFQVGYIQACRARQSEIDKLKNRNLQLEDFCQEFVYGEENPEYYSTMQTKINSLKAELEKANKKIIELELDLEMIKHENR